MKDEVSGHLETVGSSEKFDVLTAVCVSIRVGCATLCVLGDPFRINRFSAT